MNGVVAYIVMALWFTPGQVEPGILQGFGPLPQTSINDCIKGRDHFRQSGIGDRVVKNNGFVAHRIECIPATSVQELAEKFKALRPGDPT